MKDKYIDALSEFYINNYSGISPRKGVRPISYAQGGNLPDDLSEFNSGGTHGENPNGGIPINNGMSRVEQGETKYKDYIFSHRIMIDDKIAKEHNLPKSAIGKSFSDYSKIINKKYIRENDSYETKAKGQELDNLMKVHEAILSTNFKDTMGKYGNTVPEYKLAGGLLMAAPILAEGINLVDTLANKPKPKDLNMFDTNFDFKGNFVDTSQINRDIKGSEINAARDLRDASGGNSARYLANRTQLNSSANRTLANAELQSNQYNAQEKGRIQQLNYGQDMANSQKHMQIQDWNNADMAAYRDQIHSSIANMGTNIGELGKQYFREDLSQMAYGVGKYGTSDTSSGVGKPVGKKRNDYRFNYLEE